MVDEEVTGKTAGMYHIFVSPKPYWKLLYIFLFLNPDWKLCRKCEKVNKIADDLQLRKSVWQETEELIEKALDSPSALP